MAMTEAKTQSEIIAKKLQWLLSLSSVEQEKQMVRMSRRLRSQLRQSLRNKCPKINTYKGCTRRKKCSTCTLGWASLPSLPTLEWRIASEARKNARTGRIEASLRSFEVEQNLPVPTSVLDGEALDFISSVGLIDEVEVEVEEYIHPSTIHDRELRHERRMENRKRKVAWCEQKAIGPRFIDGTIGSHRRRISFDDDGMMHFNK